MGLTKNFSALLQKKKILTTDNHSSSCSCCNLVFSVQDRKKRKRRPFEVNSRIQSQYERAMKNIGRAVRLILDESWEGENFNSEKAREKLNDYADGSLRAWAEDISGFMLKSINADNIREWNNHSATMGRALRQQLQNTPLGDTVRQLQLEQVDLITSLPKEAAQRIQELAEGLLYSGERSVSLKEEIMQTPGITERHAIMVARTESARASSVLTQARAQSVGSEQFFWRSIMDGRTRASHRAMDGMACEYAKPPIVDGEPLLPGQIYNCRCWHEPILKRSQYEI